MPTTTAPAHRHHHGWRHLAIGRDGRRRAAVGRPAPPRRGDAFAREHGASYDLGDVAHAPTRTERSHVRIVATPDPDIAVAHRAVTSRTVASQGHRAALDSARDPRLRATVGDALVAAERCTGAPTSLEGEATPVGTDPIARMLATDPAVRMAAIADDAPFGLPVLAELPQLASLLTRLRAIDRLVADAVETVTELASSGLVEAVTGVGLDAWIGLVGRRTGADVRMLRTTARVLERSPSLRAAFTEGALSWAQVRSIVLAVHPLPGHLDERIDAAIAAGVAGAAGAEPDAVTRTIRWMLADLEDRAVAADEAAATCEEFVAMQPRLDGSGGRLWAELGPVAFATVDAALNAGAPPPTGSRVGVAGDRTLDRGATAFQRAGRARVDRLVAVCDAALPGAAAAPTVVAGAGSRPGLLVRVELDALLDRRRVPASLLTTLLGGHVRVTSTTARQLLDARGGDLRTVVLDDHGAVVGVGRRTRVAPGWVRDAALALHDTCTAPSCETAARVCDLDHATPWHPHRTGAPLGRTDLDELGPTCRRDNVAKERDGWRVTQRPDGRRRWRHERSGVDTTTVPATWRPPPTEPRAGP